MSNGKSGSDSGHENAMKSLRAFAQDHVWVDKNRARLIEQYDGQWIAVRDRKVIANDPSVNALISKLDDPQHTCIEFITSEPLEMIL